ncbi:hypothetical protein MPTK1_1g12620 [Marchantia polymorpha subsp. ruderalis]|uniref:Uncharacterized protein n=2 Tax=Marchantia polymorpha TaxID=3197 RepID=A0A176VJB1_MARPO|nr:hypothetical protein AXG93_154s1310 [Marchantia polymorpha subsp. ruderalis]PTQ44593.1 hypothetical protein MARPO_0019s0032 [Marchantia polymorpha]BBM98326.1 hypothetical protein Mp_1g12620 [Marchantia polymorpha subsp. ruderalis]|eukprot:PTQ44593.1 hypothetical protein MARPO_0019s0032 [Marchantia polymorpha]
MAGGSKLMEELRISASEKELLKEKLHVHFDRWGFDMNAQKESAFEMARDHGLRSAQHSYELAQSRLLHGVHMQQSLVQSYQLESARDEVEALTQEVLGLKFALQHEKAKNDFTHDKMKMLRSALQKKFAIRSKALIEKATKKFRQLERLLESRERRYVDAVNEANEKYREDTMQLNGRIQLLIDETESLKKEQQQWKSDMEELQIISLERRKLQAELEKLQTMLEERNTTLVIKEHDLQLLADHRDRLLTQLEKLDMQQSEQQVITGERDRLLAEKEEEMRKLASDMESLITQKEEWISKEKDLLQLRTERDQLRRKLQMRESDEFYKWAKERDKLVHKLALVQSQREDEVKGLIRERDFVWDQMKKIEENYNQRLDTISGQLILANQENTKLKQELQQVRVESNEKMVELTILKLEAKRAKDGLTQQESFGTAIKMTRQDAADVTLDMEASEEEERKIVSEGPKRNLQMLELTSQVAILQKQLDALNNQKQSDVLVVPSNGRPEVSNVEDMLTSDQDTFASQVEQATIVDVEDDIKTSKGVEELRRENENLRVLYGQLEALYKEQQKPEKVARNVSRRDPTSRNLKIELEAAAALSPSNDEPVPEPTVGEMKRRGCRSKAGVSKLKSAQQTIVKEEGKQSGQEQEFLEMEKGGTSIKKSSSSRLSKRNTSSSKPPRPTSSKRDESVGWHANGSVKKSARGKKPDEDVKITPVSGVDYYEQSLPKTSTRKRKGDSADLKEAQRVALREVSVNSGSKTPAKKSKPQSSRKPESESLDCHTASSAKGSRGLMADLFSSAFSIPRLNVGSSAKTRT